MIVTLSPKIKKDVSATVRDYGYRNVKEFIEDALRHRILELKRTEFLAISGRVKERMRKKGITEEEILKDFDKFSHKK